MDFRIEAKGSPSKAVNDLVHHMLKHVELGGNERELKASMRGATAALRTGFAALIYIREVTRGGHEQFFGSPLGILWKDVKLALRALEATEYLRLFETAIRLFPSSRPAMLHADRLSQMDLIPFQSFLKIDAELFSYMSRQALKRKSLQVSVYEFIASNIHSFFVNKALPSKRAPKLHSYRQAWNRSVKRDIKDLREISTWDPFRGWKRNRVPEFEVESAFFHALKILYGDGDSQLARLFLERSMLVADAALKRRLDKLATGVQTSKYPLNRAHIRRAWAYSKVMLGHGLDVPLLQLAVQDFDEFLQATKWAALDANEQAHWLSAVRTILIAGDPALATDWLTRRKTFKMHAAEAAILRTVAELATEERPIRDEAFHRRFDLFFDRIRSPNYVGPDQSGYAEPEMQRFELGAIRYLYFEPKAVMTNTTKLIDLIRR